MRRRDRTQPLIHRRALLVLVLIGLACSLPFVTSADDQPVPTPAAETSQPSLEPTSEPTSEPTPTAEPTPSVQPTAEPTATNQPLPNGRPYIVTFARGVSVASGRATVEALGGVVDATVPELRMAMVRLPDDAAAQALLADAGVARLEEDTTRTAEATPSDALFADQWALERIGWHAVYGVVAPAGPTVVAILDTGVAANHSDLAGQLLPGRSYVDGVAPNTDPNGHGTWMAGIVGAATDNTEGVAGVAWGSVRILPITVLDAAGRGQDSAVIQGLVDAVDSGADVVLLAFSSSDYSRALQAAIDYAWANDVVIVAALGNEGSTQAAYPAGDRGVIGVASTDRADGLAAGSNSGAAAFIGAPGVQIVTTDGDGGYRSISGTSAAAALVAGAAAVVRAVDPAASNGAVVARLARNAAEPQPGTDVGNGRLDLARTLSDHNMTAVQPAGAAPTGDGGPFLGPYVAAATATWTGGGGDNNWTTPGNWGGTAPVAGDDLVFPVGAARLNNTNDFSAGTIFNSITLSGTGYTLSGNSVALGVGGMTSSAAGSANTVTFAMSFAADRTITVTDSASTLTLGGIVSGSGGLIKVGSGVLALSAVNTYTGATSVTVGSIDAQSNAALGGTGTGTSVTSGAAVTVNGSGLTVAEPLTLNGTGISGAGAVRNIANNNTWSGAVTLASATTITSAAGTLTMSGAVTTATFTVTYDCAGSITKSAGVISGTGGVTKEGVGTLTYGVANTYSGATTINVGTLKLSSANGVGSSSAVTVASGATFDLGGFSDTVGSIAGAGNVTSTVAGTVTLTTAANTSTTFSGVMSDGSGVVGITKGGTGTLTWTGANTYTGVTRINAGTLAIASDAVLGTVPGAPTAAQLTFGGGTLRATATFALSANRGIAMTGTGTLNVDPSTTLSYGGVIAGSSTLTKSGTGTLILSGSNTHSGTTAVSAGVLRIQSNAALGGTATGSTVASGAVIEIDGSGLSIGEPITSLIGTGVSAGGALRNLANDNAWTAAITLGSGGARINSDAGTFMLSGGIAGAGLTVTMGGAGNVTESGVIGTTTGGLTKDGTGTATIAAANTYTGATTVNVGTLTVGIANAVGSSSAVTVAAGATFDLAGFSDEIGSLAGAGDVTSSTAGSITLTSGAKNTSTTFSGVISDGGATLSLTKTGTGTLTLSGINTYTGATTITGGTISIAADSGLGTPPPSPTAGHLTFNGGTLLASASFTLDPNRGVALTGAGTFSATSPVVLTYGGVIDGGGPLTKVGTGTLVLSGANTYSGATTITAGTLSISADTNLGTPPGSPTAGHLTFGGTATLLATSSFTLDANRGIDLTGAGTVNVDPSVTLSYGGVLDGSSTLSKSGTGTLVLSGVNTHTGTTAVTAGVLRIQNDAALGATSTGTTVSSGAALEVDGAGMTLAEPITSLTGTGVSTGGALRNLANDNTWSGPITLAGTTRMNTDGGTFTLSSGINANTRALTLGGAGNWDVSAITGTTATLTKDGTGSLPLYATNTYGGRTTLNGGVTTIASDAALGTPPVVPTASLLTFGGGTLATTTSFTLDPNRGISWGSAGGTLDIATGTTLIYAGTATGSSSSGVTIKAGAGTLDYSAATSTSGGLTISAGTVIAPTATMFDINGDVTNNSGVGALVTGGGTVTLSRATGPQVVGGSYPIDFDGLAIGNPSGVTFGYDVTVSGILTLSSGNVNAAPYMLSIASTGSVSRTSGHIVGSMRKHIATGAPVVTFEIGDASQYAPVIVTFDSVDVAGDLIASTTSGDHAALASSAIDPAQSANRFWTLSSIGLSFTTAAADFTFAGDDLDAGADTADFGVARYSGGSWQTLTTQTQTPTSTSATGITAFGDFAVGALAAGAVHHFTVIAPATATVGSAFDVTVTAVDASGNRVGSYTGTIDFSSSDPHAVFAPSSYAFQAADHGTKTFTGVAALYRAGSQTVAAAQGAYSGTSATVTVSAGAFVGLQTLLPGETADPGSATGKTGTPATQTAHSPFSVIVNAVDSYWNVVDSTDTVAITSSDPNASLPANGALAAGSATFSVTAETGGPTTVTATDVTDGTKAAGTSAAIDVTNTAPSAAADSYEMFADNTLVISAAGVLANDADAESQPLSVGAPRPASGPAHGSLTLNSDGSFSYTPTPGYDGPDSFTYTAVDAGTTSTPATVTIMIRDQSLISTSGWGTAFSGARFVELAYPAYVPTGATVTGATLHFSYRSLDAAGTLCYYIETYNGATLLATHGSSSAPISCNATGTYISDVITLAEIDTVDEASQLTIRIYMRDSAGARSQVNAAIMGVDYSVP